MYCGFYHWCGTLTWHNMHSIILELNYIIIHGCNNLLQYCVPNIESAIVVSGIIVLRKDLDIYSFMSEVNAGHWACH